MRIGARQSYRFGSGARIGKKWGFGRSRQLTLRVLPSTTFLTTQSRMIAPRNIFSGLISMLLSVRQWTSMRRARSVNRVTGKNSSSGRQIKKEEGSAIPRRPGGAPQYVESLGSRA